MLAVSLSKTNIPTSGSIQLVLDVHAPVGCEVVFPEIGSAVAPFAISDGYAEPLQTLPNGKQRHRRVWTLVPALPGETVFQALEIRAGTTHLATDPVAITTTSVLPPDLDVFELKDIAAPILPLPEQARRRKLWFVLLAGATAAMLATLVVLRIQRPKPTIVLPPHEIAFQALENLPEDPLEKIQALTDILIAYVGDRFQLQTSGKTIPEIIPLLPRKTLLGRRYKLETHLLASEQIRFSNQVPAGFAEGFEDYIRGFIGEMKKGTPCG